MASHAEHELRALRPLLDDPAINEVVINPDGAVWYERADTEHMIRADHRFVSAKMEELGNHLAADSNNKLGPRHPLVAGSITANGQTLRVQVVVPPAVEAGASISIRKYVSRVLDVSEIGFLEGQRVAERSRSRSSMSKSPACRPMIRPRLVPEPSES